MPFDDEDKEVASVQSSKVGIKNVSSQKSIFDNMPKKPSAEDLNTKVKAIQERENSYKNKTAELAIQFNKAINDKTLRSNKNIIQKEVETELLREMVKLAQEINADLKEREGEGSLSWITLLLKTCFVQRDKINELEYTLAQLSKKIDTPNLSKLISLEIAKALDNAKKSE